MNIEPRVAIIVLFIVLTLAQEILFLKQRVCRSRLKRIPILGPQDKIGSMLLFVFYVVIWFGTIYSLFVNELMVFNYVAGFLFIGTGIAIRVKALHDLGCNYTHTIKIHESHKLVTSGIYSLIRHPLYLGLAFVLLGMTLIAHTTWVWVIWLGLIVGLMRRTKLEDKILVQVFRDEARKYQNTVPAVNIFTLIFRR